EDEEVGVPKGGRAEARQLQSERRPQGGEGPQQQQPQPVARVGAEGILPPAASPPSLLRPHRGAEPSRNGLGWGGRFTLWASSPLCNLCGLPQGMRGRGARSLGKRGPSVKARSLHTFPAGCAPPADPRDSPSSNSWWPSSRGPSRSPRSTR